MERLSFRVSSLDLTKLLTRDVVIVFIRRPVCRNSPQVDILKSELRRDDFSLLKVDILLGSRDISSFFFFLQGVIRIPLTLIIIRGSSAIQVEFYYEIHELVNSTNRKSLILVSTTQGSIVPSPASRARVISTLPLNSLC